MEDGKLDNEKCAFPSLSSKKSKKKKKIRVT
jgi:hypothetical protein